MAEALSPLVAGNWKMNGLRSSLEEIRTIKAEIGNEAPRCDVVIFPPATLLMAAAEICEKTAIYLGAQDASSELNGAHTGDLSAEMLADVGAAYLILGHSERRADHRETNKTICAKARAAFRAGLTPIICVGETGAEREAGKAEKVVGAQLKASVPADLEARKLVVAYEPVWAIGTGVVPTSKDIAKMHAFIRQELKTHIAGQGGSVRILYGGSVKPENAQKLSAIKNVNGMLVGGASLKSADFLQILKVYG